MFESVSVSKRAVLMEFTTLMCRLMLGQGNRAGAMIFSGKVERIIPARGGRQQLLHILNAVAGYRVRRRGATDLKPVLADAAAVIRRRSLIFVVSDFISAPGWEKPLSRLASRHDVVAVRLTDPLETRLPDLGLLTFQDAETGEQLFVDTHDRGFRARFAAAADAREEALRAAFAERGRGCAGTGHRGRCAGRAAALRRHAQAAVCSKVAHEERLEHITWAQALGLCSQHLFLMAAASCGCCCWCRCWWRSMSCCCAAARNGVPLSPTWRWSSRRPQGRAGAAMCRRP